MGRRIDAVSRAREMKEDLVVLALAMRDKRVPWYAKFVIVFVLGYALSPIDFIPDFIPFIGQLDDLVIVPLGLVLCFKLIPPPLLSTLRLEAAGLGPLKKNLLAGVVVVLLWLLVGFLGLSFIF
jgi:uncharacterized membrane protein YkvA (DUF1232 family)